MFLRVISFKHILLLIGCLKAWTKNHNSWTIELPNIANSVFLVIEYTLKFLMTYFNKMRGCAGVCKTKGGNSTYNGENVKF